MKLIFLMLILMVVSLIWIIKTLFFPLMTLLVILCLAGLIYDLAVK